MTMHFSENKEYEFSRLIYFDIYPSEKASWTQTADGKPITDIKGDVGKCYSNDNTFLIRNTWCREMCDKQFFGNKEYIFSAELYSKYTNKTGIWSKRLNNKIVKMIDVKHGICYTNGYGFLIAPEWCEEVE